jgi:hypothetical protein
MHSAQEIFQHHFQCIKVGTILNKIQYLRTYKKNVKDMSTYINKSNQKFFEKSNIKTKYRNYLYFFIFDGTNMFHCMLPGACTIKLLTSIIVAVL